MNENFVYSVLLAQLLLSYLIALRIRNITEPIQCMHDFVHHIADISGISDHNDDVVHTAIKRVTENNEDHVEGPFKEWDDA